MVLLQQTLCQVDHERQATERVFDFCSFMHKDLSIILFNQKFLQIAAVLINAAVAATTRKQNILLKNFSKTEISSRSHR